MADVGQLISYQPYFRHEAVEVRDYDVQDDTKGHSHKNLTSSPLSVHKTNSQTQAMARHDKN